MPKISAATLHEHRAETIDRLLDAWGELVMTRGYEGLSLADVAAKAGLARTAIYNYFPDREALLFAWTHREVQRTMESFERELQDADSVSDKLRAFVRLQLEAFAARHLPPGQEVMQFLRPETYSRFHEHIEPVERVLTGILEEGFSSGEFKGGAPEEMGPMVMACVGAERIPIAQGTHDVGDAAERVSSFLLRALGAPA
jgi:AcrR family transcriptional regulator